MKNANEYAKRMKRLLPALRKKYPAGEIDDPAEPLDRLLLAILRGNATAGEAKAALRDLREEFVDYNEIRVAPAKDIVELLPAECIDARGKAERIAMALEGVFEHGKALSLNYLKDMGKRELRSHLRERLHLDSFAEAHLTMTAFGGEAMPIDGRMAERLKAEQAVHESADIDEIRTLLERIVPGREMRSAFESLSAYAADVKAAPKKREKTAEAPAAKAKTPKASKKTTRAALAAGKAAKSAKART